MFCVSLDVDARLFFSAISLLIALPTSIKVFSWLVSLLSCLCFSSPLALVFSFLSVFSWGGLTGFLLASCDIDLSLHDGFFVVGHFHFVLSLGAVLGLLSGGLWVSFLFLGVGFGASLRLLLLSLFYGAFFSFWPLFGVGSGSLPRRVTDFADLFLSSGGLASWGLLGVGLALVEFCSLLLLLGSAVASLGHVFHWAASLLASLPSSFFCSSLFFSSFSGVPSSCLLGCARFYCCCHLLLCAPSASAALLSC